jgi:hypothetical protein
MDIVALKTELDTDPLARGYSGMTNQEATDSLNIVNRNRNRTSMLGTELIENTDATEFALLSDAKKSLWLSLCGIDSHDPFGSSADIAIDIWGAGSDTITALQALRVETVSRSIELFGEKMRTGYVEAARLI